MSTERFRNKNKLLKKKPNRKLMKAGEKDGEDENDKKI